MKNNKFKIESFNGDDCITFDGFVMLHLRSSNRNDNTKSMILDILNSASKSKVGSIAKYVKTKRKTINDQINSYHNGVVETPAGGLVQ